MIVENTLAPDFLLQIDQDNYVTLKDYLGKYLILYFYPKDNTAGCTLEAQDFASLNARFNQLNAVIVGVSPDNIKSHHNFKTSQCLPFNLASDFDLNASKSYECWVEKSMYGKKYMGIERSSFLIDPNGIIRKIWRKVSVKNHASQVLQDLTNIQLKE